MSNWESPGDPWVSSRLIYRSVDDPMFEGFMRATRTDGEMLGLLDGQVNVPRSKKSTDSAIEYFTNTALVGVVICLKPDNYGSPLYKRFDAFNKWEEEEKVIPIGTMSLGRAMGQHRNSTIGISFLEGYRSKGYGTEALRWLIHFGFSEAGLHSISINCFGFNEAAIKCYTKLGFRPEGRRKEIFWRYGKFWDEIQFGMLEDEWREIKAKLDEKTK